MVDAVHTSELMMHLFRHLSIGDDGGKFIFAMRGPFFWLFGYLSEKRI